MNSKFEFLSPKRVYRCPCLHDAIKECFHNDELSIADIVCYLKDIHSKNLLSTRIFSTELEKIRNTVYLFAKHIWKLFYSLWKKICVHHLKMTILFVLSIPMWRRFIAKAVWNIIWDCCILNFILLNFDFWFSFLFQKKKKKCVCIRLL